MLAIEGRPLARPHVYGEFTGLRHTRRQARRVSAAERWSGRSGARLLPRRVARTLISRRPVWARGARHRAFPPGAAAAPLLPAAWEWRHFSPPAAACEIFSMTDAAMAYDRPAHRRGTRPV